MYDYMIIVTFMFVSFVCLYSSVILPVSVK